MMALLSDSTAFHQPHNSSWFAVRTKRQGEAVAASALRRKGWECLLPRQSEVGEETGEALSIPPLFDRLVFCRFRWHERIGVLACPGVVEIVGQGTVPAVLSEVELQALRTLAAGGWRVMPWPYTADGPKAQMLAGPLAGLEGFWAEGKPHNGQLILSFHAVARSVALEVDRKYIQVAA